MAIQPIDEHQSPVTGLSLEGVTPARLPEGHPPVLLVVIDTEEEFDWQAPLDRASRAVSSIREVPTLQRMFDELGVRPTYVVDHPVAATPESAAIMAAVAAGGNAEIGAHLHPWVTPPDDEPVTPFNSYAGNLPAALERSKLECLVASIEKGTGQRPVTYKAGRYGIGRNTPALLRDLGFTIDCSSSPGFNWSGDGGPDYARHPNDPYWLPGTPDLLELPTTGGYYGPLAPLGSRVTPVSNVSRRRELGASMYLRRLRLARRAMLSPEGFRLNELQTLTESLVGRGLEVLTLSFHSPSLAPGHTPFVRSQADRADFLATIRAYAEWCVRHIGVRFMTCSEVRRPLLANRGS